MTDIANIPNVLFVWCIYVVDPPSFRKTLQAWESIKTHILPYVSDALVVGFRDMNYKTHLDTLITETDVHTTYAPQNEGKTSHINRGFEHFNLDNFDFILFSDSDIIFTQPLVNEFLSIYREFHGKLILAPMHSENIRHHATILQYQKRCSYFTLCSTDLSDGIAGGCWMVPTQLWNDLGGYEYVGKYGPEDILFARKAKQCGYEVHVVKDICVIHPF